MVKLKAHSAAETQSFIPVNNDKRLWWYTALIYKIE